jgi:glycosyltransferase involved in cell wall biosynthesis
MSCHCEESSSAVIDGKTVSVSIIIPLFNAEDTVPTLIDALSKQTYPREYLEIVFVDNGSSDNTVEMLKATADSLDTAVKLVEELEIPGSYAARNKGIENATGDILAFTDADCVPAHDWVANAIVRLNDENERVILGGRVDLVPLDQARPTSVELFEMVFGFPQEQNVVSNGFSVTANLWAYKAAFESIGFFNARLKSKGDFEWCVRAGNMGYRLLYASDVAVVHPARRTLKELFLKTRRVTGGQKDINTVGNQKPGQPRRSFREMLLLVVRNKRFPSWTHKLQVVVVAALVLIVKNIEKIRLHFGTERERR